MATSNEVLKLDQDVQTHYNEILKTRCAASPWKLFTFEEAEEATLVFVEEGTSINDFKANLSSDKVIFGLLRIADNKPANVKGILVLVYWCGQNAELELREVSQQQYKRNAESTFSKCDRFISIESEEDLERKLLVLRTTKEHRSVTSERQGSDSDTMTNGRSKKKFKISKRKSRIRESSVWDDTLKSSLATDETSGDEQLSPTAEPSELTNYNRF